MSVRGKLDMTAHTIKTLAYIDYTINNRVGDKCNTRVNSDSVEANTATAHAVEMSNKFRVRIISVSK